MVKRRRPPSQGWRTFLRKHAQDIAAMDLFVIPTIGFDPLYAYIVVRLDRRELIWINVHSKSHRRMGCASNHGGIPLERGSALHDPRPGSHLWCGRHTPMTTSDPKVAAGLKDQAGELPPSVAVAKGAIDARQKGN
jgi:hypothetical protein